MGNSGNIPEEDFKSFLRLKEVLESKLTIDEFSKCINNISKFLENKQTSFINYVNSNVSINDEQLVNEFFRYCLILASSKNMVSLPSENLKLAKEAFSTSLTRL